VIQLQIDNPDVQEIFEDMFHSNHERFANFIVSFLRRNRQHLGENIAASSSQPTFEYKKLNPLEHYYTLSPDAASDDRTNPFADVRDSVAYAKTLREASYR